MESYPIALTKRVIHYYNDKQIPLASAGLCYYVTMTFFPMIICLYTMLGNRYELAMSILDFAKDFLSANTVETIGIFLAYVEKNRSTAMLVAGATVLLTSASAGVRSMQITIGRMQGGQRYGGIGRFVFSLVFSIVFLAATWFAIIVMFTSRDLLQLLNENLPFIDISTGWQWIKYLLLAGILFLFLWGIYRVSRKRRTAYPTWPGAIAGTLGILVMSLIFSTFISASARYSLVYGSLTSIILLMVWLYFSCQIIYIGAAFNVSLRDVREQKRDEE